ncbi:hypothetical protein NLU13_9486 [Sarocladium strictum]|uniref:Uncharacterized protein n=1 Tax=Sarocladium strictum TaxID=5046 RepID=A0AA39GA78_SARSR|nr:hypothetical protein NLU13_9486 [Sarocladium strictum]
MLHVKHGRFGLARQSLRITKCTLQTSLTPSRPLTSTSKPKRRQPRDAKAKRKSQENSSSVPDAEPSPQSSFEDPSYVAFDPLSPFFGGQFNEPAIGPPPVPLSNGTWTSLADRLLDRTDKVPAKAQLESHHGHSEAQKPGAGPSNKSSAPSRKGSRSKGPAKSKVTWIDPFKIHLKPIEEDVKLDVPKLQHNLDRVLFNPGVHVMRDSRSRVYNFDPDIAKIMPADEFDYEALGEYITSSKDQNLRALCTKYNKKYCGSTSSLSAILSHFHYLISAWRKPNFSMLSGMIKPDSTNFTQILRSPAAAFAHYSDGSYAIDADKEHDVENILSSLGKSMEKHLLLPKDEFDKYRLTRSHEIPEEQKNAGEAYHYSELGDFLVRSQLDAYDPRLPGSGVFDIKTRAVVSIRMDVLGYEKGLGYEISKLRGPWHSFEREYMDMIRAAFLKYSLQVRMGRMDGIFCAYHNTQRIFGFQYIPLPEMDLCLHGTYSKRIGDEEFRASLAMFNALLDRGTKRWPGRTLRLHVETRDTVIPLMYFFIEPVSEQDMQRVQKANKSKAAASAARVVEKLKDLEESLNESTQEESDVENSPRGEANETSEVHDAETEADEVWDELMSKIEEVVESDTNGLESVRAAVVSALDRQGLMEGKHPSEMEGYVALLMEALIGSRPEDRSTAAESDLKEINSEDAKPLSSDEVGSAELLGTSRIARNKSTAETPTTSDGPYESYGKGAGFAPEEKGLAIEAPAKTGTTTEAVAAADVIIETDSSAEREMPTELEAPIASEDGKPEHDAQTTTEASGPSLQELVMRAADNVDNKSGELRAFERVFAELLAEAKAKGSQKSTAVANEGGPSPSSDNNESWESETQETTAPLSKKRSNNDVGTNEILGMVVTVRNKLDGKYVDRPDTPFYGRWQVGYSVTELEDEKARRLYAQIKKRRSSALSFDRARRDSQWYSMFRGNLQKATRQGRELRERLEREDQERQTIHVAWDQAPRPIKKD